jgi:Nucleotidyl transferase AbiEii toxin, Type IV TA system
MGSELRFDATWPGVWQALFVHAQALMDDMCTHIRPDAFWTFGGGTVLMLRHGHRLSKDIDLFVPDPQYLGFVNPRLSDFAAGLCSDYVEAVEYVKLIRGEGEIDIVTGPNLTSNAWTLEAINGRPVRVETDVEIVAKKMWHRGNRATARDLFDLALVISTSPDALRKEARWLVRHRDAFLAQLSGRRTVLMAQFEAIDFLKATPDFDSCAAQVQDFLLQLVVPPDPANSSVNR